jgi:hypothetical protein
MATENVLALCGVGTGPRIPLRGSDQTVTVRGLRESESVTVNVENEGTVDEVLIVENGEHEIYFASGRYACCQYLGTNPLLMCFVRS